MSTRSEPREVWTLRAYLFELTLRDSPNGSSGDALLMLDAIATTAMAHPEWPSLDETRTWEAWDEYFGEKS